MRVLISAFYFSPYRGSEAGVGWQTAVELAKFHDVTVICGDVAPGGFTGLDLQKWADDGKRASPFRVIYVPPPKGAQLLNSLHALPGLWFLYYKAYNLWQRAALVRARELHEENPFDLVHHVNVIGYREPGYLWKLGIPWFWGPISGAPMIPWDFIRHMGLKGQFRWGSRNLANWWQMRFNSRCKQAARTAKKIWTVTPEDYRMVTELWGCAAEPMLETGGDVVPGISPKNIRKNEPLRIVWSGLFQPIKALPLLLNALAQINSLEIQNPKSKILLDWHLDVLGDGEEQQNWKKLALQLGIESNIRWHGMLPRNQALDVMKNSHVLVHTSVKEGTPHVVLEALSLGLPVICHDACGMGTAVDATCGIKVSLQDRATSISGFRSAVQDLLINPDTITVLSAGALMKAATLTWESKIEAIEEGYRRALLKNQERTPEQAP